MSSRIRVVSLRKKSRLSTKGFAMRMSAGLAPVLLLAACAEQPPPPAPQVVKSGYQAPDYSPARDGNWHVGAGYDHPERIMNDFWPRYLAVVSIAPTDMQALSGGTEGTPKVSGKASTISIPVLEGRGHLRQIVPVGDASFGIYADITGNRRVGTERGVSVAIDVANASQVVRLRQQEPVSPSINKTGQTILTRTISLGDRYYLVTVSMQRGPGTVFDQAHAMATDKMTRNAAWGSALPMEQRGGSLSDVVKGGAGHYSPSPDFHDPVDPQRGGFGPSE